MKLPKLLLPPLFTFILIFGCNKTDKIDYFDYGNVTNGIYQNDYFKIKIVLPANWIVQSKEETESLLSTGKDFLSGNDDKMKELIKASEINIAYLLSVFQFKDGAEVDFNPSITILVENIKNSPDIKNGNDYLFHTREIIMQSQLKYDYISDKFEYEKIGNMEFYKMNTSINLSGIDIKQINFVTVMKGFCISFVISFVSDEQRNILLSSMHTLTNMG